MINLPDLKTADVSGKKVFLRSDLDVPLTESLTIADDTRLSEGLETLKYLLDNGAHVIVAGHLGRPSLQSTINNSQLTDDNSKFSLKPVADWYAKKFNSTAKAGKVGEFDGWQITPQLYLLENLRFYPEEEANDSSFSQKLASLSEIYVDNAFANIHRAHASMVGITQFLPHYAGFMLVREVNILATLMENPKRPLTVIIGGAKIETKLPMVEKMHQIADYVLVGGKIAEETKTLIKVAHERVLERKSALIVADLIYDQTDMTPNSVGNFLQVVNLSQTVIWNGPVGVTEGKENDPEIPSAKLARGIAASGVYSVVGGGDTIAFLRKIGLLDKFSFVSTGGGAMLEFLSGEKLPGIEALTSST
ncbi:MAG: phosphoglycerate kinase [Patescibacteria group bacterium]